ncbi:MAG: DUF6132 family protein [Bacteroidia bacterium]
MIEKIKKQKYLLIGVALGAVAGYAYYYFIGCTNGTCAITSNPLNSTLYGIFMGGLLGSSLNDAVLKKNQTKQ